MNLNDTSTRVGAKIIGYAIERKLVDPASPFIKEMLQLILPNKILLEELIAGATEGQAMKFEEDGMLPKRKFLP